MTEYQITMKQMQILRFLYMYFNDNFQNGTKQLHKTKQKYSLIFDKSFIKPDTQSFMLRVNFFKCVKSSARMLTQAGKASHVLCFHY